MAIVNRHGTSQFFPLTAITRTFLSLSRVQNDIIPYHFSYLGNGTLFCVWGGGGEGGGGAISRSQKTTRIAAIGKRMAGNFYWIFLISFEYNFFVEPDIKYFMWYLTFRAVSYKMSLQHWMLAMWTRPSLLAHPHVESVSGQQGRVDTPRLVAIVVLVFGGEHVAVLIVNKRRFVSIGDTNAMRSTFAPATPSATTDQHHSAVSTPVAPKADLVPGSRLPSHLAPPNPSVSLYWPPYCTSQRPRHASLAQTSWRACIAATSMQVEEGPWQERYWASAIPRSGTGYKDLGLVK